MSDQDRYRIDKRTFWAWQRQQEQHWLERKSKDGWELVQPASAGWYFFSRPSS